MFLLEKHFLLIIPHKGFSSFEILNLINEVFIDNCQNQETILTEISFKKKFKNYTPAVSAKIMNHFVKHVKKIGDSEQLKEIDSNLFENLTVDYIV